MYSTVGARHCVTGCVSGSRDLFLQSLLLLASFCLLVLSNNHCIVCLASFITVYSRIFSSYHSPRVVTFLYLVGLLFILLSKNPLTIMALHVVAKDVFVFE